MIERKDVFLSISKAGFNVRLWGYLAMIFSWSFSTLWAQGGLHRGLYGHLTWPCHRVGVRVSMVVVRTFKQMFKCTAQHHWAFLVAQ